MGEEGVKMRNEQSSSPTPNSIKKRKIDAKMNEKNENKIEFQDW